MKNFDIDGTNFNVKREQYIIKFSPVENFYDFKFNTSSEKVDNINSDILGLIPYKMPFSAKTNRLLLLKLHHKTKLLDNAQALLGLQEVTPEEYALLTKEQKMKTQGLVIGKHGPITDQWCAHTVSYICEKSKINIGPHKSGVSQFISWAGNRYKSIKTQEITVKNYTAERQRRAEQISKQLNNMKEGDLIVWKTDYAAKNDDKSIYIEKASHIGFIESVNIAKGIVTVIEGNANEPVTGKNFDRSKVKNKNEGINGNQSIGEPKEMNRRDGLIRKQYTIEDLAKFGYSGYIDMQDLLK